MKLLYLRVFETHRELAFENKDLNFGGNRRFHYFDNETERVLKESLEKNYFNDLYDKDLAANCIVGYNGIGKTTLMKFLLWLLSIDRIRDRHYVFFYETWIWLAVFEDNGKLVVRCASQYLIDKLKLDFLVDSSYSIVKKHKDASLTRDKDVDDRPLCIYYTPHMEFDIDPNFDNPGFLNVSTDFLLYKDGQGQEEDDRTRESIHFRREDIKRQIAFINFITYREKSTKEFQMFSEFIRQSVLVHFFPFKRKFDSSTRYIGPSSYQIYTRLWEVFLKVNADTHQLIKDRTGKDTRKEIKLLEGTLALLWFYRRLVELIFYNFEYRGDRYIDNNNFMPEIIDLEPTEFDSNESVELFEKFLKNQNVIDWKDELSPKVEKFKEYIQHRSFVYEEEQFFRCHLSVSRKLLDLEQQIFSTLKYPSTLSLYSIDWEGLSTGERAYLNLFSRLHYSIQLHKEQLPEVQPNRFYFMIDEPATGFHPEWQTEYFSKLIVFLKLRFGDKNNNVILATHSPFVLSDFQGLDVIAINAKGKEYTNHMTFGANIHELLADSFFLEKGFVGDFALGMIKNLIVFLQDQETNTEFNAVNSKILISLIGEPVIRERLEELYEEKFGSEDLTEIEILRAKIEELESENQRLRK